MQYEFHGIRALVALASPRSTGDCVPLYHLNDPPSRLRRRGHTQCIHRSIATFFAIWDHGFRTWTRTIELPLGSSGSLHGLACPAWRRRRIPQSANPASATCAITLPSRSNPVSTSIPASFSHHPCRPRPRPSHILVRTT